MPVYHLEIRKFPKALTRFNQTGQQVGAIVLLWVQERILDLDDQKWSPHEATLTILEGPAIPLEGLSMGRGWRTAQREGTDVTERILAEARQALAEGAAGLATAAPGQRATAPAPLTVAPGMSPSTPAPDALALGVELAGLLGPDAVRLLAAWRDVTARTGGLAPSESLALAERELRAEDGP